jgi:DNA-binding CsgD family transcriptional regulator
MKDRTAFSHLRQLCCLGIGAEMLMPSILAALHDVIGSDSNGFFWVDDNYDISNMCAEKMLPPETMQLYFRDFYGAQVDGFKARLARIARGPREVTRMTFPKEFYDSDYYNLIWRRMDAHHAMYAPLYANGRCIGQLSVYRSRKDPGFAAREEERLEQLLPYIQHALGSHPREEFDRTFDQTDDRGFAVLDGKGEPCHMSAQARRLLFLAAHPNVSSGAFAMRPATALPAEIDILLERLARIGADQPAPPPSITIDNVRGRFHLRADWLESPGDGTRGLVGLSIEHLQPREIRLLHGMKATDLSTREREAALLLALGRSVTDIADALNCKPNTAKYFQKQIYNKLAVHDRAGLLSVLLA